MSTVVAVIRKHLGQTKRLSVKAAAKEVAEITCEPAAEWEDKFRNGTAVDFPSGKPGDTLYFNPACR